MIRALRAGDIIVTLAQTFGLNGEPIVSGTECSVSSVRPTVDYFWTTIHGGSNPLRISNRGTIWDFAD